MQRLPLLFALAAAVAASVPFARPAAAAGPPDKTPIILDTDIGSDVDDAFALALALASPELDLVGVTTVGDQAEDRAMMVCRMLTAAGRKEIPVAWGRDPQPKEGIEGQIQYRRHPAVIYNRTAKPVQESAVDFLYARLKERQGKLTIVALGPLTNVARLLADHPACKPWIKRIVLMGGSVRVGYEGKPAPEAEWNIKLDPAAARAVFTSGVPLAVAPLDATASLKLDEPLRKKLFAACTPLTFQVQALYQLWDKPTPTLFDPAAVALGFTDKLFTMEDLRLDVGDDGFTRIAKGEGEPNARVATAVKADEFLKWYVDRVSAGEAVLPKEPANRSDLVPHGLFPNRVHCFEDYETDIEKRWWMSGKAETDNVPLGSTRACRGVLTQDFDDLQGDMKTMYTAVIFNPVPGPPMGKNPRVGFRYWLKGTDTLRVQIYSLTKGYHRYLSLTGLAQEKWTSAAVDMTQARRPDGTGGPLSEDERIDDVQFYADPRADLLIDDMVLYDAAAPEEKRPFPRSFQYTGWFDTGKQGKEWLGDFEIPEKSGYFWKAAKSVDDADAGAPWIRLQFHTERPCGDATSLFFRYRLTGADGVQVRLINRTQKQPHLVELKSLKKGEWAEATAYFTAESRPRRGDHVDEIHFLVPKGAELLVDDVLLYEPGGE
jgi:inosine-uridine nucleoside N-ribohydrolase